MHAVPAEGFTFADPYNYGPVDSLTWPNPKLATKSSTWDIGAFVNVSGEGLMARGRRLEFETNPRS